MFNEYRAPVWIYRALLADPHRTLYPLEAGALFVPAYLQISKEASPTAGKERQVPDFNHESMNGGDKGPACLS